MQSVQQIAGIGGRRVAVSQSHPMANHWPIRFRQIATDIANLVLLTSLNECSIPSMLYDGASQCSTAIQQVQLGLREIQTPFGQLVQQVPNNLCIFTGL